MDSMNEEPLPGAAGDHIDSGLLRIAGVVLLGSFMSILDTTIVNVALKSLSKDFSSSLATIQWVSTGYMLALATVIPLSGWAADRFGTKRLYIAAITLFLAGSALAAAAWSINTLILFRVLQGLGGGMIMPAGMTILSQAAGPRRMGRVMGMVGVPMLMGPIIGPILGGWLVDDASWRWIFLVNVPVGCVAILAAARILRTDEPKPQHALDWTGFALLSPGLAIFVYGLAKIASDGGFNSASSVATFLIGLALLAGFVFHSRSNDAPLIDIRLFARRNVGAAAMTSFMFSTAFASISLLMPLYFQVARDQSALHAGSLLAAQGIGAVLTMPIASRLTDKIGPTKIVLTGLLMFAIGLFGLTQIKSTTSFPYIETILFITGMGMGSTMMPAMSAAMSTLRRHEVARATSGLNVLQRVGGSIGTALIAVALTHQLAHLMPGAANNGGGLAAISSIAAHGQGMMAPIVDAAFGQTFRWPLAIVLLAMITAFFIPRGRPAVGASPPHVMTE